MQGLPWARARKNMLFTAGMMTYAVSVLGLKL